MNYPKHPVFDIIRRMVSVNGDICIISCIAVAGFLYALWLGVYSKLTGTLDAQTVSLIQWIFLSTLGGKALSNIGGGYNNNYNPQPYQPYQPYNPQPYPQPYNPQPVIKPIVIPPPVPNTRAAIPNVLKTKRYGGADDNGIDWTDMTAMISKHFTVGEATYLHSWGIYHIPSDEEKQNLVTYTQQLDMVRDAINMPFVVHCMIRPTSVNCPGSEYDGQNYNAFIGSTAKNSPHIVGRACDFNVEGYEGAENCEIIRQAILPYLEQLNMRMERASGSGDWVHLDNYPVVTNRYFQP